MVNITYGDFSFPTPLPFVALDENPVFISGQYDHSILQINLIGTLTGCDIAALKSQKELLENGLSSGFKTLTVGNTGYDYAKPISIRFSDSELTKTLPYEASFEAFHEKEFSQFYGIESPVDTWEYTEEEGRKVGATHTVSAIGKKVSATDSLAAARAFVNGRIGEFENKSLFFSGDNVIKVSTEESINRFQNSYGITESYVLSESLNSFDSGNYIVRPSCDISYDVDSFSISVNGTIEAGITGVVTEAHSGIFTPDSATEFAKNSVQRSKIDFENDLYGEILRGPISYSYDYNTGANSIDFSFDFGDPTDFRTGEVLHDFSTSFEASKDNGFVNATINGELRYNSTSNPYTGQSPELETRFQKIQEALSGVSQFSLIQNHFSYFKDLNLPYSNNDLDDNFESYNIDKNPHESLITYTYNYTNKQDLFSGYLRNGSLTITTDHPIPVYKAQETIDNSFSVQEVYDTIKKTQVSLNGTLADGRTIDDAVSFIEGFVSQYSGQKSIVTNESLNTGDNKISFTKSFAITNE